MPRDRQRGNSLLLALIVMSALATLGSLTVVSVQSSLKASTNDRFQSVALYAAESGAAAAMIYLRQVYVATSSFATAIGATPPVFGNNIAAGAPGNPFSNDQQASYSVAILPGPLVPLDHVVIRSTGYGAQGSTAIIEWDVAWDRVRDVAPLGGPPPPPPIPPYNHGLILLGWRVINL